MKEFLILLGVVGTISIFGNVSASPLPKPEASLFPKPKECYVGPSYWCQNITTASSCNAVTHCIQTVWEHKKFPKDTDSVCKICKDMVAQARDQLQSNETQEELKEVFEGSCKLIPLKVITKECIKLADDFIPDLVETLASQMNPDAVCSVAGLCNNARIDELLKAKSGVIEAKSEFDCDGCYSIVGKMESSFMELSRDEALHKMIFVCRNFGSFSDMCANVVLTYFNEIYEVMVRDFQAGPVCHLSGVCSAKFHQHPETGVEIMSHGSVGVRAVNDDLPCDLCTQLVTHLREVLVANTTEAEFKQVLEGLCSQTRSFKKECFNIVDEYYGTIYSFLVQELQPKAVCVMANLCPQPTNVIDDDGLSMPMLTSTNLKETEVMTENLQNQLKDQLTIELPVDEPKTILTTQEIQDAQLPIDRIMPQSLLGVHSSEACSFCEYILHFIQVEISDAKNEAEIKQVVETICHKLPSSVSDECDKFVETYGDAFIALLAEEIDPSQICPMLSICPKENDDVEVMMQWNVQDKPNCPLCLFAVKQLEEMVKEKKTEETIEKALNELCVHLPKDLSSECDDFVATYTRELIEMLLADLDPQEVCGYLKLCDSKPKVYGGSKFNLDNGGDILTNEIPDITIGGQVSIDRPDFKGPPCVLCKVITEQVLKALNGSIDPEDIKNVLHQTCNSCPEKEKCNEFVSKYFDTLVDIISKHTDAEDICSLMFLCVDEALEAKASVTDCIICEETVRVLHMMLKNPNVDHEIEHLMKKACMVLPPKNTKQCEILMSIYGKTIIEMLEHETNSKAVCTKINLCSGDQHHLRVRQVEEPTPKPKLIGAKKCTWGPSYWCSTIDTANECKALEHCRTKVWLKDSP